jgi:RES domain-containing protein
MPIVWRLADPRFADDLEGSGNRLHGARWNSPGRGVVYCSENLSLCVLETSIHLNPAMRRSLPPRTAIRIEIQDDAEETLIDTLPTDLDPDRLAQWCRQTGDRWLSEARTVVLRAPSLIVREEHNIMLNPAHPRMRRVRIADMQPFMFDERLVAG